MQYESIYMFFWKKSKLLVEGQKLIVGYQGLERQEQRLTTKGHEGILEEDENVLYIDYGVSHMLYSFVKDHKNVYKKKVNLIVGKLYLNKKRVWLLWGMEK